MTNLRPTQTMPKLMNLRSLTGALVLLLVLGLAVPGRAQQDAVSEAAPVAPGAVVAQVNETLIGAMREAEALAFQGRYDRLAPVFAAAFRHPSASSPPPRGPQILFEYASPRARSSRP